MYSQSASNASSNDYHCDGNCPAPRCEEACNPTRPSMRYVDCPACRTRLIYGDSIAGQTGQCPRCGRVFSIPVGPALSSDFPRRRVAPNRNRKVTPLQYHVCEVFISPTATPDELRDAGRRIFGLSLDGHLNGVQYDAESVERLLRDGVPPVFIPWTEPELQPIMLKVRKDEINEGRLTLLLERALTGPGFSELKVNGESIR